MKSSSTLIRVNLCFFFLCFSASANAVSTYTGKIMRILVGPSVGSNVYLTLEYTPNNSAACATNSGYSYVFDVSTDVGKNTLSTLLTAYAAGKTVYLEGYETCSLISNTEDLKVVRLE